MDVKINFRYANSDDIKKIAALEKEIFHDPWTEDMVRADIEAKISRYIIAENESGEIIGYLGYWLVFDECSINNVAVIPSLQGKGIGSAIMEQMIKETEAMGARVWVLEVRAGNESGIALYEKYGFKEVGRRKKYYEDGEDAIVMHRYMTYDE